MNLKLANRLAAIRSRDRANVGRFLADRKVRLKVVKAMQAKGVGVGVDPDNIGKWLELILKYLPLFLEIILKIL